MGNVANIIYGAPEYIKVGAYGSDEATCKDMGFTDAGLSLTLTPKWTEILVDQFRFPVDAALEEVAGEIKVKFREASLSSLQTLWGLSAGSLSANNLAVGSGMTGPKLTVYIKGPGPAGGSRTVKAQKVYVKAMPALNMNKSVQDLEVTFGLLADPTVADQKKMVLDVNDTAAPANPA